MKTQRRGLAALALIAFILGVAATNMLPQTVWGFGATKEIATGKLLQINPATQGYLSFSDTLFFTGYSRSGTGGINDFSGVRLGAAGYTQPRLGFTSDEATENMTVTNIDQYTLTYTMTGAAISRVWCPDLHEPLTITGGFAAWDDVNQVVTVTNLGADTIVMTWSAAATSINLSNYYNAFALIAIIPLLLAAVAVIGIVGGGMDGETAAQIAVMMVTFAISGILAVLVFTKIAAGL